MPETGTLTVRVFTSRAQIPLPDASVAVSRRTGRGKHVLLAIRTTDENGETPPLLFSAPAAGGSEQPGTKTPFTSLDIRVEHPEYETELAEDVQIFPGVVSILPVALVPLSEYENPDGGNNVVLIPPQTL